MRRIAGPLLFVASLMLFAPVVSIVKAQYAPNPFLVPTGSQLLLPAGTAANPSLAEASTPNAGFYFPVAGAVSYTQNSIERMAFVSDSFRMRSTVAFGFSNSTSAASGVLDTILTRGGVATLQLGAADAAAPVAQTLQAQGVAAGTSDVSGANLTITSGNGRGSAAGSSLIFQTPTAVGGGNGAQTMTTRLTFTGAAATFTGNVVATNYGSSTENLTAGTMTYNSGWQRGLTHEFLWTNAMLTAGAAATTWDVTVATIPAKTQVINALVVIITSQTAAGTLTVQCGDDATFINYVKAGDAKAAANTVYGDLISGAETGTALFDATAKWIPAYLPSYTGTTAVTCRFISNAAMSTMTASTGRVILTTRLLP